MAIIGNIDGLPVFDKVEEAIDCYKKAIDINSKFSFD